MDPTVTSPNQHSSEQASGFGLGRCLAWLIMAVSLSVTGRALALRSTRLTRIGDANADERVLVSWGLVGELGAGWLWAFGAGVLLLIVMIGMRRSGSKFALILPAAVAVLVPIATRIWLAPTVPAFDRHLTTLDLLEQQELWKVLRQHPGKAPSVEVLTPAVDQHRDSGDKPALLMVPPCEVEIQLPEDLPPGFLRLAAGIDKTARGRLPKANAEVQIDFAVEVNGVRLFEERITNTKPRPGQWGSDEWTWRHADPDRLPVQGGDRIVLRTTVPAGHPANTLPVRNLLAGFGGCVIETRISSERKRASSELPNIIFVVQDTLRADRCSTYGYERETTPVLTRLADRGMLFEDALSTSSWTWPSTASLLTGLAPDAHGVTSNESCTLNLSLLSVAEVLQSRGYSSAAISCNPLIVPARNFDQGFESFDFHSSEFRKSDEVMPAALRWLDVHGDGRFFLYLHLADPHTLHRPRPEDLAVFGAQRPEDFPEGGLDAFGGLYWKQVREGGRAPDVPPEHLRWVQDVYDASVRTGDYWLGVLLERLDDLGLADSTVVAFTSDHGEELLDRGRIGHGHGLHRELTHVPLVLSGPGIPVGHRVAATVSNRHLAPTLAALGGGRLEGMGDGGMLFEAIGPPPPEGALFATQKGWREDRNYQELVGYREGGLTLHWWLRSEGDVVELYDQSDDRELRDLAQERASDADRLLERARAKRAAQKDWAPAHQVGVGASGFEMLKGVGYVGGDEEHREDR